MKLNCSAKAFYIFALAAVLAAGLIAAEGPAAAQTSDSGGSAATDTAKDLPDAGEGGFGCCAHGSASRRV